MLSSIILLSPNFSVVIEFKKSPVDFSRKFVEFAKVIIIIVHSSVIFEQINSVH
jgi:hypothetical protein